jgi:peptide subunit release factor RF-3
VLYVDGEREHLANAKLPSNAKLVEDWNGRAAALFENEWSVRLAREWNPQLTFTKFSSESDTEALAS